MAHMQAAAQLAWDDPTSESPLPDEESASSNGSMEVEEVEEGLGWMEFTDCIGSGCLPKDDFQACSIRSHPEV